VRAPELDAGERAALVALAPAAVVLFTRNVAAREQLAALVAELRALPSHPAVAVDLEGGRVHRLAGLVGSLPSARAAAAGGAEAVAALGDAAACACAHFGITIDFAPVVDVAHCDGFLGGEDRCFGADRETVATLAGVFVAALEARGVSGCLKHFPGLGSGSVDSHRQLPELSACVVEDAAVFARLASPVRAIMVAHAIAPSLGDVLRPASLSRRVIGMLRGCARGPVIADDLEMGALGEFGSLGERAAAALGAGCDQVLLCNALDARHELVEHVRAAAATDPTLAARLRSSRQRCVAFGAVAPPAVAWDEVERAAERARSLAGRS